MGTCINNYGHQSDNFSKSEESKIAFEGHWQWDTEFTGPELYFDRQINVSLRTTSTQYMQ